MKQTRFVLIILCSMFLSCASIANAQSLSGISGQVKDASGALIPHAEITALNTTTGASYQTISTSAGVYSFPSVTPGSYRLTAGAAGFKQQIRSNVLVNVATTTTVDLALETGAANEVVTVVSDSISLQTETSELGGVITTKQALDLPLNLNGSAVSSMRSPEAFVFLVPGVVGPGTANGSGGAFESKITGGQNYSTEILLDGASVYRSENGSSFDETGPSIEALSEFKVITSTPAAEYGRSTGGFEVFSTTAGTSAYHGKVYDIFKNEALDANTWGANLYASRLPAQAANYRRPNDKKNDYGGTFGGPVWIPKIYNGRDRTNFFFSWEQFRQNTGAVVNSTVPTNLMRQGNFSEILTGNVIGTNPCDGTPIYQGQIFNPNTTRTVGGQLCRTAFANNIIPANFSANGGSAATGARILAFYPAPLLPSVTGNYQYRYSAPILDTTYSVRVDQNISTKQHAYFTYNTRQNVRPSTTPIFANAAGDYRNQVFTTHYIRFAHDYTLTANLLNHLTLGYNRTNSVNTGAGARYGQNYSTALGVPNVGGRTFPAVNVGGANALGDNVDNDTIDNGYRINDSVTWTKGRHTFRFGTDLRFQIYNPIDHGNESGTLNFGNQETAGTPQAAGQSGSGIASLYLGLVNTGSLTARASQPKWVSNYQAYFAQDSFKLTPTFTINYGLRWELDTPRREAHDNTSNLVLTAPNPGAGNLPGALVFAGTGTGRSGRTKTTWVDTYTKNFGPRLGIAWAPSSFNNRLVVHAGGSVLYAASLYADFGGALRQGFTNQQNFDNGTGFLPTFNLTSGLPNVTPPPNLDPSQLNFQSVSPVFPEYGRPGQINNWSADVQHEIAHNMQYTLAYVGQRSAHLRSGFNGRNSINPGNFALGNLLGNQLSASPGVRLPYAGYPTSQNVAQSLRPYPQYYAFLADCCLENLGHASYDALQASLTKRFSNGQNIFASYTWSKTITNADSALPVFASFAGGGNIQNPYNSKGEKSLSNQDTPNAFVVSYVLELPVGKGKHFLGRANKAVDLAVGGWEIGAVQRYQSGQPLSFGNATGVPGFEGGIRYNRVPGQPLLSQAARNGNFRVQDQPGIPGNTNAQTYNATTNPNPYRYFNYASLTDPNSAALVTSRGSYVFGNQARTTGEARSFLYKGEDFSFIKRFHVTERVNVRFEGDMINAFNRHIFNRPVTDGPNDSNGFGYVDPFSYIVGPRNVQFLMKVEF